MTSAYVQTAWFITLGCEQQSAYFLALLIKYQGVIEKFKQNRPESRKIETVMSFWVAQRDRFFRMLLHVLDYRFLGLCKFFSGFFCGKTAYVQCIKAYLQIIACNYTKS